MHGRRGGRAVHRLGAGLKRVVMLSPVPTPFGKILVSLRSECFYIHNRQLSTILMLQKIEDHLRIHFNQTPNTVNTISSFVKNRNSI